MKTKKFLAAIVFAIATMFGCKAQQNPTIELISWEETKTAMAEKENIVLVDVRTPEEYAAGSVKGAENINFFDEDFKKQFAKFDKEKPVYIFCKSGNRSAKASKILAEMGFEKIYDVKGGYLSWKK
ncbi:MAG TPA: rhodanese-like domain-containing protein [Flavobacteriaceae bacterium]|nr:rhodanese-like domain-containing protein [Flavobacteriaceae bacterium]